MTPSPATKPQILDAFAAQLAAGGYQGISLTGVARAAGIQKPSIYHHFPKGKEEIFTAVALRFISELHHKILPALQSDGDFAQRLEALALAVSDDSPRSISFDQRVYDTLDLVSDTTKTAISAHYVTSLLEPVAAVFTTAVAEGDVHGDPWFLMNSFLHISRAIDSADGPDGAGRVVALFLDGARPR